MFIPYISSKSPRALTAHLFGFLLFFFQSYLLRTFVNWIAQTCGWHSKNKGVLPPKIIHYFNTDFRISIINHPFWEFSPYWKHPCPFPVRLGVWWVPFTSPNPSGMTRGFWKPWDLKHTQTHPINGPINPYGIGLIFPSPTRSHRCSVWTPSRSDLRLDLKNRKPEGIAGWSVHQHLISSFGKFWAVKSTCQWLFLVPLKGGIGSIFHPPIGRLFFFFTTYIPLIVLAFWGVICHRSHLLGEPETTIDLVGHFAIQTTSLLFACFFLFEGQLHSPWCAELPPTWKWRNESVPWNSGGTHFYEKKWIGSSISIHFQYSLVFKEFVYSVKKMHIRNLQLVNDGIPWRCITVQRIPSGQMESNISPSPSRFAWNRPGFSKKNTQLPFGVKTGCARSRKLIWL